MSEPVIIVEDVAKTFSVPRHHVSTLKERALHPFRRAQMTEYEVLKGVSFDVQQGEFFGIVGRNGSGKSTLLKCMAGIYRIDRGRIATAGRLAPFIELGVGFNMDLTAYDNVTINGVMMGLTAREARRRFDAVLEFAELEDYVDLKLKNYSSGMQVRLAFSLMVQSDADVYLIDEVLAVGDAAFQQKCLDVFYRLRDDGKTIVLVTHDMSAVERFCHRAMFIRDGVIDLIGDSYEVGKAYMAANFESTAADDPWAYTDTPPGLGPWNARVDVLDELGRPVTSRASGTPLEIRTRFTPPHDVKNPELFVVLRDPDYRQVTGTLVDFGNRTLIAGEPVEVTVRFEAELAEAHYDIGVHLHRSGGPQPLLEDVSAANVLVHGARRVVGAMKVPTTVTIARGEEITEAAAAATAERGA